MPQVLDKISPLAGRFGAVVEGLTAADLQRKEVHQALSELFHERGGLLIIRGARGLSPQQLVDFTAVFGKVEEALAAARSRLQVTGTVKGAVMRIGNTRDPVTGEFNASFVQYPPMGGSDVPPGKPGFLEACQYDPSKQQPIWHTDATFRLHPPAGSVLYCVKAPPIGADTCFADATAAFESLPAETRYRLKRLQAVCSLAHHDANVHLSTPSYPLLPEEKRLANPPVLVPLVLQHPQTGRNALYAVNRSTCFVRPLEGPLPTKEELARAEGPEAYEEESVERELRALLPHITSPKFTVRWRWSEGDVVVWDNRSTMHCGSSFDHAQYTRELWRTTFHDMDSPSIARLLQQPLPGVLDRFTPLADRFGAVVECLKTEDLQCPPVRSALSALWSDRGGLLVIRGIHGLSPQQLVDFTAAFGKVEGALASTKTKLQVEGTTGGAVMRIGNTRDPLTGEFNASFIKYPPMNGSDLSPGDPGFLEACQYIPTERRPIWHTDATFRARPPAGSVLYCVKAPPMGGDTCFADATAAFENLPAERRWRLKRLMAVCSLAHHDANVHQGTPSYPLLPEDKRMANPAVLVPLVLQHPQTGRNALYAMNRSTCFIRSLEGPFPSDEELDRAEGPEAYEEESVERELRSLLPHATSPQFTVRWRWCEGDIVVWDNRSVMHCGSGFDSAKYTRELWRTTFHDMESPSVAQPLTRKAAQLASSNESDVDSSKRQRIS